jgi:hypothetical protein
MLLDSSLPISLDDLLAADLQCAGVSIIHGVGFKPLLHLCCNGSVLTAQQEEGGYCSFEAWDQGPMPWPAINVVEDRFNCTLNRRLLVPPPSACSQEQRDAIVDMLGEAQLGLSNQILQYVSGKPHGIEPGTRLWQRAEIARALVDRNPELAEEQSSSLLLLLVEEAYDRQDPPHRFMIRKCNPAAAKLVAQSILDWVERWGDAAKTPESELL